MLKVIRDNFGNGNSVLYFSSFIVNDVQYLTNQCGIYCIMNIITGDRYIGQSTQIRDRVHNHIYRLQIGTHHYKKNQPDLLQKSFNKYGEAAFYCYVVELCEQKFLDERERFWIDYYQCNHRLTGKGFNLTDGGNVPPQYHQSKGRIAVYKNEIQRKIKPEQLDYFLQDGWQRGVPKSVVKKQVKTRISHNIPSPMKGKKHTEEWSKQQSQKLRGRVSIIKDGKQKFIKTESLAQFLEDGWVKGTPTKKEETIVKIKQTLAKRILPEDFGKRISEGRYKEIVCLDHQGNLLATYPHVKIASKESGETVRQIGSACRGTRHRKLKYVWRYKKDYDKEMGKLS